MALLLPTQDPGLRRFLRDLWANQHRLSYVQYVDTQSMSPSLQGSLELLVEWGAQPKLEVGDLVIFEETKLSLLVAHRVCQIEEKAGRSHTLQLGDRLRQRGIPGGWISADHVFGRVIALRFKNKPSHLVWLQKGWLHKLGIQIARSSTWFWRFAPHPDPPLGWLAIHRFIHWFLCNTYRIALIFSQKKADDHFIPPSLIQKS